MKAEMLTEKTGEEHSSHSDSSSTDSADLSPEAARERAERKALEM
jgi:hypothetical protein